MATVVIGWQGTWTEINEVTRDDSDFIRSHILPLEETLVATFVAGLTTVTDPVSAVGHVLHYTYKKNASAGRALELKVELLETTTVRATRTHSDISSNWVQADSTLTAAEANSITDYSVLRVRFTFTESGTGTGRSGFVSWFNLELPIP